MVGRRRTAPRQALQVVLGGGPIEAKDKNPSITNQCRWGEMRAACRSNKVKLASVGAPVRRASHLPVATRTLAWNGERLANSNFRPPYTQPLRRRDDERRLPYISFPLHAVRASESLPGSPHAICFQSKAPLAPSRVPPDAKQRPARRKAPMHFLSC